MRVAPVRWGDADGRRGRAGWAVKSGAWPAKAAAATRLYGLVDSHLLWAWDIAALGEDLRTHASGRLSRVS